MFICIYICSYTYMFISVWIYIYICNYTYVYIYVWIYIYIYVCTYKCISLQNNMSQRCTSWFERSVVLRACTWLPSRSLHTQFLSRHYSQHCVLGSCLSSHSLKICWPPVSHSPQGSSATSSRSSSASSLRR